MYMNSADVVSTVIKLIAENDSVSVPSLMMASGLSYRQVRGAVERLAADGAVTVRDDGFELEKSKKYFGQDISDEDFERLVKTLPVHCAEQLRLVARHDVNGFGGYGYKRVTKTTAEELYREGVIRQGIGGMTLAVSLSTAARLLEVLDRIPGDEVFAAVSYPLAIGFIKSGRPYHEAVNMPVLTYEAAGYFAELMDKHEGGEELLPIPERPMDEERLKLLILKSFIERSLCGTKREYEKEMRKWVLTVTDMEEAPPIFKRCVKAAYDDLRKNLTLKEINDIRNAASDDPDGLADDFDSFDEDDD